MVTTSEITQDTAKRQADRSAYRRVALLIAGSVIMNTMIGVFTGEKLSYLYKDQLHLSASAVGTLGIITGIPGYLRPFMGATSDLFPLLGYHRRTYFALSWLLIAAGYFGLSLEHQPHYATVAFLVIVALAGANLLFVIMDAVMVAVGNLTGTVGQLQMIQQFLPLLMMFAFAANLRGYVTQNWSYHLCFLTAAILAFAATPLTLLIQEKPVTEAEAKRAQDRPVEMASKEAREAARRADRAQVITTLRQAAASPGLWAVVGFVFYLIITPGTNTAQFYFMNNVLHFTPKFIGQLGSPGSFGAMLGILAFGAAVRRLPVRAMVWGAYLMDCTFYPVTMGLHGHNSAIIVTFVGAFLGSIYNLCLLTIAARACPPGIEGAIYGLVIAAITLGGTLGEKIGSTIYDYFGPAHHYTTTHGWFSLLWVGFGFTVIAVVFIPFLPAWAKSKEPLRPRSKEAGEEEVAHE
jgi:MFS family permease